jgi:hypothetical protein
MMITTEIITRCEMKPAPLRILESRTVAPIHLGYNILTGQIEERRLAPSHIDVPLVTPRT